MDEVFIPILGAEGRYEISQKGEVRSLYFRGRQRSSPKKLKPGLSHGYWSIVICINGKSRTYYIHKLLAQHFIPNPNNYRVINHIDGNRANNELDNLEWCTHSQNCQHDVDFLSNRHGSKHVKAKFKDVDILKILILRFKNGETAKEISDKMNVTEGAITNICAGRRYKKEYAKILATPHYAKMINNSELR